MSQTKVLINQAAFTSIPSCTSIATKNTPARNASIIKPSRHAKRILAKPSYTREAHVSHRQVSSHPYRFPTQPSAPKPKRVANSSKQSVQRKERNTVVPSFEPANVPGELLQEHLEKEADVRDTKETSVQSNALHTKAAFENALLHGHETKGESTQATQPALSEEERIALHKQRRENKQRNYLAEQLEKRHLENLAKKAASQQSQSKPQKRARSPSRSRPSASSALKDSFQAYMNEISREELLDHAQIIKLANRVKESVAVEIAKQSLKNDIGRRPTVPEIAEKLSIVPNEVQRRLMAGTAAKNTLVSANLRLVTSVARKVALGKASTKVSLPLDDMVQEGSVGLIKAAEKFDATRGYKFSTYATWWIRAYIMRSISTQSRSIRVPSSIIDEYVRIRKEYSKLRVSGNVRPSDSEVARILGITPAKLRFVVNVVTRVPASLDISLGPTGESNNSRSLGEVIEGHDRIEERMVEEIARKELDEALRHCLKPLERAVIKIRFGLEDGQSRTLRETGALLGLSKERIRQIIFRALQKMRTPEFQRLLTDAITR